MENLDQEAGSFDIVLDEEEYFVNSSRGLHQYIASTRNQNTEKKTKTAVNKFRDFVKAEGFPEDKDILSFSPENLDTLIGNWVVKAKKEDGGEYEPDSLTALHRGLARFLADQNYGHNILTDTEFLDSRNVLKARRSKLKMQGLGNKKNKSESLTFDDEEQMWAEGGLGRDDPDQLQHTVWYLISRSLGFRGLQEARQLAFGDLEEKVDEDGDICYEWTERVTKTRKGNTSSRPFNPKVFALKGTDDKERCPVDLIKEFISRRPASMMNDEAPFFLQVNRGRKPDCPVWYKGQPVGVNTLGKFMKSMAFKSGISQDRRLTNHSVRKTCCSRLLHGGVPGLAVSQLSGHKNIGSLNHYHVLNNKQQMAMARILSDPRVENPNHIPGSRNLSVTPGPSSSSSSTAVRSSAPARPKSLPSTSAAAAGAPEPTEEKPVIFNITNSGGGSVQIVYGEKPNLSKISNQENAVKNSQAISSCKSPQVKRRRILPLNLSSSDSEDDFQ